MESNRKEKRTFEEEIDYPEKRQKNQRFDDEAVKAYEPPQRPRRTGDFPLVL